MKDITNIVMGLMVLLFAALNLTSCSITDPSENFEIVVEGEIEKTVIDEQRFTAQPESLEVFTNAQLGGATLVQGKSGNRFVSGADAEEVDEIFQYIGRASNAWAILQYIANQNGTYDAIFKGTIVNNSNHDVTVEVHIAYREGYNPEELKNIGSQIAEITLSANETRVIDNNDDFERKLITQAHVDTAEVKKDAGLISAYLYIVGRGDPNISITIPSFRIRYLTQVGFAKTVTPGDVANYTLESLDSISLGGSIINHGQDMTAYYYLVVGDGSSISSEDAFARNVTYPANDTWEFQSNYNLLNIQLIKERFPKLFPPDSQELTVVASFSSYQAIDMEIKDFRIIAEARIREND